MLVGLRGKVVWVVFWSANSLSGGSGLVAIEHAWSTLKSQGRFTVMAVAVDADNPDRVRAAVTANGVKLPVYLASAETRRQFGALQADPPLNVLIDPDGRIATIARGTSPQTIDRIADQARRMLDQMGPVEDTRFAEQTRRTDTREVRNLGRRTGVSLLRIDWD